MDTDLNAGVQTPFTVLELRLAMLEMNHHTFTTLSVHSIMETDSTD